MKNNIFILIVLVFIVYACDEEPIGQTPVDNVPPGPISDVKVDNIPGGAILTYTLPQDEDLLYVKAIYALNEEVIRESRASVYSDTLKVEGFGNTEEREVKLVAVDRSKNESPEVIVKINPLEPAVTTIGKTLELIADFGGVQASWENPDREEISVVLLREDNNGEYVPIETFYSTVEQGTGSVRGMDTLTYNFGIFVQDRWRNYSETQYFTLKPLYETKLDKLKFREIFLPGDSRSEYGWVLPHLWDDIIGYQGFHTLPDGNWPQTFTMDLGDTIQLSRVIYHMAQEGTYIWNHGSPKKFEIWGCTTLDPTGDMASWTKLRDCTSIKPSGLPIGENSAEDVEKASNGEEFTFSPELPKVRYIRFRVKEGWAGIQFIVLSELTFYGDSR